MAIVKILVCCCASFLLVNAVSAECVLSEDVDNYVVVSEGDLELALGTAGAVFELGQTVRFELMVTNKGLSATQIEFPVHYPETILVSEISCPDVVTCMGNFEFSHPPVFLYVPGTISLDPGECRQWTMEWDLAADPSPIGTYKAWGGLFAWTDGQERLPLGEWILPAEGATILIELVEPVAVQNSSWSETKAIYR